jgi:tetratricopeptide (TPR) repeat protein
MGVCLSARVVPVLRKLGIETPLQLAVALCVTSLVIITTIGSGGPPLVFFIYRTLLVVIVVLCVFGSRSTDTRVSPWFLVMAVVAIALMLVSVLRIQGSHFEGLYLWYRHSFFICMFLALAHYSRYQSAGWKGLLLGSVVVTDTAYLLRDIITKQRPVLGFSRNNADYFATYLLIGVAASLAVAVFGTRKSLRIAAAASAVFLLFGIAQTESRGATLAVLAMVTIGVVRAADRIPRRVWLFAGLIAVVIVVVLSPRLMVKFFKHGEADPYNYARPKIWLSSIRIIGQNPVLGTGFGQFFTVSKRFAFPMDGQVARYLVRISMAHSEYLQHMAELGIPAAALLFSMLGIVLYLTWKRAPLVWPEFRCFHEAAILTAAGVGAHGLVDNCWTIPVTAAGLVVLSLSDLLPLDEKKPAASFNKPALALGGAALAGVCAYAIVIPGLGIYYNEKGHQAYDRFDFTSAERYHIKAVSIVPNNPLFLDNLGMVYLDKGFQTKDRGLIQSARTFFDRAIAATPQSLDPHMHMEAALIQTLTGRPENDIEIYKRIIKNDQELLQIDPFIPFSRKNLADAFYQLGKRERAFQELNKAIEYEPNYVPAYLQFAAWYAGEGNKAASDRYTVQAITIINKYRNFQPSRPYETLLLARPAPDAHPANRIQ